MNGSSPRMCGTPQETNAEVELKLFVWEGFCPNSTEGIAYAIAENEREAKDIISASRNGRDVNDWGDLEILPISKSVCGYSVGGG